MIRAAGVSVILGKRRALQTLDMTAKAGEVTGIIGPNGSGKTTLLRVLAGVLTPTAGQVWLGGTLLTTLSLGERSRRLAYLPQGGEVAWPLKGRELVALGRLPWRAGVGGAQSRLSLKDRASVDWALERAACTDLAERRFSELSGGEKARLLLARALATEASVLLADEPVAALDPGHQVRILSLLLKEARRGACVILILHDLSLAARFCDRLWLLCDGRVAGAGPTVDLLNDLKLEACFDTDFYRDFRGRIPVLLPL